MAGLRFKNIVHKARVSLSAGVLALTLAACGTGDGPPSIPNQAVTPLPDLPAGFCDPINFEIVCPAPDILNFNGGVTVLVDNPDRNALNDSETVARMQKFSEEVFGGTRLEPDDVPIDFSAGQSYTIKVWSERPVPVLFKLEETNDGTGGTERIATHDGGSQWQELCFDFTGQTPANTIALTIIFDNGVLGQAIAGVFAGDWTFYYDEITQVSSCSGGGGAAGIDPEVSLYDPAGSADLSIPDDYAEVTAFGSGSVIDPLFADDDTFSPVLAVSSGTGYGANVAQIGYTGFDAGFLTFYDDIIFKAKGLPNSVIFVKLFDGIDSVRINLTSSGFSTDIGDGWFQVSIPLSTFTGLTTATGIVFESDNTAPMQFAMLLNDIGFSEASGGGTGGGGTGGGGGGGATGITPDNVVYASDPGVTEDLAPAGLDNFGSGAVFDVDFTGDSRFSPALQSTSGEGYGSGVHVAFVAFTGYTAGFAQSFENFVFKVNVPAVNQTSFEVKFIGGAGDGTTDTSVLYDLTTYSGVTDLGDGWLQVSVPMSDFAANIAVNDGFLLGPAGGQPTAYTMLLTDIGFAASGSGGGGGGGATGITPDNVVYATDPGVTEDLAPAALDNFGSGAVFDFDFTGDSRFSPALQSTSGEGYGSGVHVAFVAFTGYTAGFAQSFENFVFKVNVPAVNQTSFEVKFIGGAGDGTTDTSVLYDLTTYSGVTDLGDGWLQVSVPMSDFAANIAVNDGFLLGPAGGQPTAYTMLLTDIGFAASGSGGGGTGGGGSSVLVNGDFEDNGGSLDGWTLGLFDDAGGSLGSITADSSGQGGRAGTVARLTVNASAASFNDAVISQEGLGAGTVMSGDTVNVSFDLLGTPLPPGGVVFAEVIFLDASGMDVGGRNFLNADPTPISPTSTWTTVTGTVTAGTGFVGGPYDVSGGLVLSLKASCGAVDGCALDVSFDNVTFTIN